MKQAFEITDQEVINTLLADAAYGTLALCHENRPYSLPINFVAINGEIYFHGAKKGRKIEILKQNTYASFSVVESYALIPSYFSSTEGLACPATHFFKSLIIDGSISFVEEQEEKALVLQSLMQKLQPEGKHKPLHDPLYTKAIHATTIYKLTPDETKAKFKFGQHLNKERFEMILEHLEQRGEAKDLQTMALMQQLKEK